MDAEVRTVMELMEGFFPRPSAGEISIEEARAQIDAGSGLLQGEDVASVEDRTIPGPDGNDIPVRVYRASDATDLPVVVYLHGGGFVLCGLGTHDGLCRATTNAVGCVTVSVDYRLAPEHRYPAAPRDSFAATQWVVDNAYDEGWDGSRLAVAGDSAGGNLSAVVAQMARDLGGPAIALQLLIYPVVDPMGTYPSHSTNGHGYFLEQVDMDWYHEQYFASPADGTEPYAAPIRAESLAGLPPAYIVTAEFDPLRDEGEAYGAALQAAGVPTTVVRAPDMFHGFFNMGAYLPGAKTANDGAFAALREALGT